MKSCKYSNGLNQNLQSFIALIGLILFYPIMLLIAFLLKVTSQGSILFKQERLGRFGKPFIIYKFRTMRPHVNGSKFTYTEDKRITKIGGFLRKYKLDEIPQLWNILNHSMSFVGPRPEVKQYINLELSIWQDVLSVRPGLTDPITIELRNEQELLSQVKTNKESFYVNCLLPYKLKGQLKYIKERSWLSDLKIIFLTILSVLNPSISKTPSLEKIKKVVINEIF